MGTDGLREGRITANGISFGYLEDGTDSGPLALCFHGFPDSAWTWQHLLPVLAEAGYHAIAPFLRGYAPTDIPDRGIYQTGALVADACALHDAFGGDEQAVIVGHDWGALAAYGAAVFEPKRWSKVVGAAVPPGQAVVKGLFTYDQLRLSWYFFFFQSAFADVVVPMDDLAFIDRLWADWSPGFDGSAHAARAKDCLREPANLTAAIGYYRAMLGSGPTDAELSAQQAATTQSVPQPTLYLHGARDGCMGVELAGGAAEYLGPGSHVVVIADSGHFLHLEAPEDVNEHIVTFLTS
jgi:pimeloyl-ACP methyl ester carboxylesterase